MSTPSLGRIVQYRLSDADIQLIKSKRRLSTSPQVVGNIFSGNEPQEGQVCAAMIVRVFEAPMSLNLQVFLDGNDSFWACSPRPGTGVGEWSWPTAKN